jgi:hypothetical protein
VFKTYGLSKVTRGEAHLRYRLRAATRLPDGRLPRAKGPAGDQAAPVPDPEAVARFLQKVLEIADSAPQRARASLSRILLPSTLVPFETPTGSGGTQRGGP